MKGQGIIEAIYSVGVLGLILTGAVVLILMSYSSKKNDFDRKKAVELGTMVVEELIYSSKNDQANFWLLNNISNASKAQYPNFVYSVGFTNISGNTSYPNCGVGVTDCAEVVVKVDWQGKAAQSVLFNRFFAKNGY